MSTDQVAPRQRRAPRGPLVVLASVVLMAVVVVAVSAFATTILGIPTTYGSGIQPSLGAKLKTDFLADQQAEASALSQADQTPLGGYFTDSALADLVQQISQESGPGTPPTISFQPASLTILRATDPSNLGLNLEVQEDGTKAVASDNGPNAAPSEQTISFHGDFWLRLANGRYAVADQQVENLATSPLPAIATVAAALIAVAVLGVLVRRRRSRPVAIPVVALTPAAPWAAPQTSASALQTIQMADAPQAEPGASGPRTLISTFGGLHIREAGQDFASQLLARSVSGLVWLRLLVAAIRDPRDRPSRDEIAKQVYPRGGRESQLKGMRNFVSRGLPQMPAALRERILVEPEVLGFDLDDCEVDAIELLSAADDLARRTNFDAADASRVRRLLEISKDVFLPEYERVEEVATGGHPSSSLIVRELRDQIADKRAQLALLLADHHLRSGRANEAAAVLERASRDQPQRKDVADRLAAAYRAAGREADATSLERNQPDGP